MYSTAAPGSPKSQLGPGENSPPNASPNTQTTSSPGRRGQAGRLGPAAPGSDEQHDPEPDLDPHHGGGGRDRVTLPDADADRAQAGDPPRGPSARGLEDVRRQAQGHVRLELQDPVDQPEQAEADPEHTMTGGLDGRARRRAGHDGRLSRPHGASVLHRSHDVPGDRDENPDEQDGQELLEECVVERRNDDGVVVPGGVTHTGHRSSLPCVASARTLSGGQRPGRLRGVQDTEGLAGGDRRTADSARSPPGVAPATSATLDPGSFSGGCRALRGTVRRRRDPACPARGPSPDGWRMLGPDEQELAGGPDRSS